MGGGLEWRLELLLQGNSPKCPRGFFSFWEKSSCSILWLPPYKDGPVLSHSPLLQLGRGLSGSGSHTAQLSTLFSQRPQVSLGLPLSPLPLPATSGNQVSHSFTSGLVWKGRGPLIWLSPRSPEAGLAREALVPVLVPGTFLS